MKNLEILINGKFLNFLTGKLIYHTLKIERKNPSEIDKL